MRHTLALIALITLMGCSSVKTIPVRYTWTQPQFGSPVKTYTVQHKYGIHDWKTIGTTNTNEYVVECVYGVYNFVRVCGVDAQNRIGIWSVSSDAYIPTQTKSVSTSQYIRIGRD